MQTLNRPLAELDFDAVLARIESLAAECQQRLDSAGVAFAGVRELIEFDMLYTGQTHTLRVEVARAALDAQGVAAAFEQAYREAFGRTLPGIAVRVMNLRYARIGERPKFDLAVLAPTTTAMPQTSGLQRVFHAGRWWDALRYPRLDLPVGATVPGPAILEQPDTTVWLEPGFEARVDALGNLLISSEGSGT